MKTIHWDLLKYFSDFSFFFLPTQLINYFCTAAASSQLLSILREVARGNNGRVNDEGVSVGQILVGTGWHQ
jgi:hypothetical protein